MGGNFFSKIRHEFIKVSTLEDDNILINETIIDFINNSHNLRLESEDTIVEEFRRCFFNNKELSLRALFYIRDIKNGLGERRVFRTLIKYLANTRPDILKDNLIYISEFGRWDDYYSLFDSPLEKDVISIFKNQIEKDLLSDSPSNLGKWMKSENTSSKHSKYLGYKTRVGLNMTSKEYRQTLSTLRKKLNILERQLSSKTTDEINLKTIPVGAIIKYKKVLFKGDYEKYIDYVEKKSLLLSKNKDLHPFNLVSKSLKRNSELYEPIWYIQQNKYKEFIKDTFVICDFNKDSTSNSGIFSTFITFLLLFNSSNTNYFKNYFMYYNSKAKFYKLTYSNFSDNIKDLKALESSKSISVINYFDNLLFSALRNNIDKNSIPKNILIMTTVEEDSIQNYIDEIEEAKSKWEKSVYTFPKIKVLLYNDSSSDLLYHNNDISIVKGNDENLFTYIIEENGSIKNPYIFDLEKLSLIYKNITV